MKRILAIIPCAGLGSRMGMPLNQSKELLLDTRNNKPLIEWHLNLCKSNKLDPLIITRPEKIDLIEYCIKNKINHIISQPGKEWMDTVELSRPYWYENNILLLPDTRFQPKCIIKSIKQSLQFGCSTVFALHKVQDISKWGYVTDYGYCEKLPFNNSGHAWGILGFKKNTDIFKNMSHRGIFNPHKNKTNFLFLNEFYDITRTGKIEYI